MRTRDWMGLLGATWNGARVPATALPDLFRTVRLQVVFTFVHAIPIVTLFAVLGSGFVLLLRGTYGGVLQGLTPDSPLGALLLDLALREAIPLGAAIVIVARSGTAVASELAAALVGAEVEAMEELGVSPVRFWVVPRVIGIAASTLGLALYLTLATVLAYWVFAGVDADFRAFATGLLSASDLMVIGVKALLAGGGVAFIAAGYGLLATASVSDLPRSVAAATMGGVVWCVASSLVVTAFVTVG